MKKYLILYIICFIFIFLSILTIKNYEIPEPDGEYFAGTKYVTSGGYTDGDVVEIYHSFYTDEDVEKYTKELRKENIKESMTLSTILSLFPCLIMFITIKIRNRKTST